MKKLFDDIPYGISANIMGGGFIRHPRAWTETKTKNLYTLWSLIEGDISVSFNGTEHKATTGDAVLFSPGDTYSAHTDGGCGFTFVFFTLKTGNSLDLLSELQPSGIIPKHYTAASFDSFNSSFIEQRSRQSHGDIRLYSEFFSYISDIIGAIRCGGTEKFCSEESPLDSDMHSAIDFINENYENSIQIKDIAHRTGLSEKHFITKFKSVIGVSPKQYAVRCKMKKAFELISGTDSKLSEIALQLGYSDQYSLSKAFKKFYGESPTAYRKSNAR